MAALHQLAQQRGQDVAVWKFMSAGLLLSVTSWINRMQECLHVLCIYVYISVFIFDQPLLAPQLLQQGRFPNHFQQYIPMCC